MTDQLKTFIVEEVKIHRVQAIHEAGALGAVQGKVNAVVETVFKQYTVTTEEEETK